MRRAMNTNVVFKGLPEMCYALEESEKRAIIIKRGESGYHSLDWDPGYTDKMIDELNEGLEVSKAQAEAMLVGSMFGWNVPGANPENYDENGRFKNTEYVSEGGVAQ